MTSGRFLKRFTLPDDHAFIGRMFDLSILQLYFDDYSELEPYEDCRYAYSVIAAALALTNRLESLNMVGAMMWPKPMPRSFADFPISRYDWLNVSADAFLGRYVSVADCALILSANVFECGLAPSACSVQNLRKKVPVDIIAVIEDVIAQQGRLRQERNRRFHHGAERGFSSDDQMLRVASTFERIGPGRMIVDGRSAPTTRLFREGLVELQRDFNSSMRILAKQMSRLYDLLHPEFEARFSPKFQASTFWGSRAAQGRYPVATS